MSHLRGNEETQFNANSVLGHANWESLSADLNAETMYGCCSSPCFLCGLDWFISGAIGGFFFSALSTLSCRPEVRAYSRSLLNKWSCIMFGLKPRKKEQDMETIETDSQRMMWSAALYVVLSFPSGELKNAFEMIEILCDTVECSRGAFVVHWLLRMHISQHGEWIFVWLSNPSGSLMCTRARGKCHRLWASQAHTIYLAGLFF